MSKEINPVKNTCFSLAEHGYRRFDCSVPSVLSEDVLTDSKMWVHVAPKLNPRDEIRILSDDCSFMAHLLVTYSRGTDVRTQLIDYKVFEDAMVELSEDEEPYFIKLCGPLKYCIVKRETGERIKENIPDKKSAVGELQDYLVAMSR